MRAAVKGPRPRVLLGGVGPSAVTLWQHSPPRLRRDKSCTLVVSRLSETGDGRWNQALGASLQSSWLAGIALMIQTDKAKIEYFGDFETNLPQGEEYLTIGFSPTDVPLKKRWENNGLSADFIADYFRTFFVSRTISDSDSDDYIIENLREGVKYISNELLENAMKFQDDKTPFTAQIVFSLYNEQLIFMVSNGATFEQATKLQKFIKKIQEVEDPGELYFEALADSAREENAGHSGLGLLSMISDYSAMLGWRFLYPDDEKPNVVITTMVKLPT